MAISSPHPAPRNPAKRDPAPRDPAKHILRRSLARSLAALLIGAAASAQTLAHPGWNGNGLNTDPWWQHAVFYEIGGGVRTSPKPDDSGSFTIPQIVTVIDFKYVAARLDTLRSLGADALLLPAPHLPAQPAAAAPGPSLDDPALNDLDELIHQASRRGLRVLLILPAATADPSSAARFWLSRGVAGFYIVSPPGTEGPGPAYQAKVQAVRRIAAGLVGQRIVLSDFDPGAAPIAVASTPRSFARRPERPADAASAQLQVDARPGQVTPLAAAALRALLTQTPDRVQPAGNVVLDFRPAGDPATAKAVAAVAMTTHWAALIDADERLALRPDPDEKPEVDHAAAPPPVAPPPVAPGTYVPYVAPRPAAPLVPQAPAALPRSELAEWYKQLSALHHGNAALRYGTATMLDFDAQNALVWVNRPATASALTPPVVVACNLSATPVRLALGAAIKGLNLRGTYLRTLLRSDKAMGPQDLDAVMLPPFSVYIGELRR